MKALLRIPLFYKVLLANVAIAATLMVCGYYIGAGLRTSGNLLLITGALGLACSGAVNALLIRYALSPLVRLEAAAVAVESGDYSVSVSRSAIDDAALERLITAFNTMVAAVRRNSDLQKHFTSALADNSAQASKQLESTAAQTLAVVLLKTAEARRELPATNDQVISEIRDQTSRALDEVYETARKLRVPSFRIDAEPNRGESTTHA